MKAGEDALNLQDRKSPFCENVFIDFSRERTSREHSENQNDEDHPLNPLDFTGGQPHLGASNGDCTCKFLNQVIQSDLLIPIWRSLNPLI